MRAEGSPIIRRNDLRAMNNKNTVGRAALIDSTATNALPQPQPPPLQTAQELCVTMVDLIVGLNRRIRPSVEITIKAAVCQRRPQRRDGCVT